ncbi:MAG: hypothetical protein K2K80_06185 [Clostridia bacterium]|nr:hypothetical protein [Clostridia bacterium]
MNTDKNEHWKECDFDLEEQAGTRGAHVDANHDNTCDDCGYNGGALPEAYTTLLGKEGTEAVVADTFLKSGALTTFGKWGTAGVYTAHNSKGTDEGNYSEVKDGIVKMTDSTGGATHTVIDFGGVIGTIEGYFEMTFENAANSWTPVQFYSTADKEFFGLRTDGGSIKYRLDGGSPVAAATDIAPADLTKYAVYFKYDRANNKLTMTINDKAFAEVSVNVEGVAGFKLVSSDSNGRIINLDNLVVVNTPVAFADYKAELDAKVTSMMPPADNQYTSAEAKAKLGAALAAYNTASAAATTNAQIKAAYDTFETEYVGAVKLEVKAQLLLAYPANKYNTNKADYDKAIADFDSALEKASSMQAVQKAMEDAQKVLGAIEDDTHAAIANITVEVKNAEGITVGSVTVKAGTTVTADDLKTEISAPTGKRVEGFYTEAACTTAAELPLDTTGEAVDKTYTYYVKFEDIPASEIVTHTLDVTAVSATAYTAETDLDGFFSVNNKVKQESAKMNSGTYTKQVSLTGGKADMSNNAIKFTITKSAVVTVVAGAKSDKSTVKLSVLDSKGAAATVTDIKLNGTASEFQNLPVATSDKTAEIAVTYTFRLEAGTYYFGGNGGGAYIFALSVAEGA